MDTSFSLISFLGRRPGCHPDGTSRPPVWSMSWRGQPSMSLDSPNPELWICPRALDGLAPILFRVVFHRWFEFMAMFLVLASYWLHIFGKFSTVLNEPLDSKTITYQYKFTFIGLFFIVKACSCSCFKACSSWWVLYPHYVFRNFDVFSEPF